MIAAVVLLALLAGGLAYVVANHLRSGDGEGTEQVLRVELVTAGAAGEGPFTPSVAVASATDFRTDDATPVSDPAGSADPSGTTAPSGSTDPAGASGSSGSTGTSDDGVEGRQVLRVAEARGDAPQLFGSAGNGDPASVCDAAALKRALAADPAAAEAWAELQGVAVAYIDARIDQLTPLVLGRDTIVTNSQYRSGKASTFPAILQSGTAVMVDDLGVPRVRCSCGNPLSPPPLGGADGSGGGTDGSGGGSGGSAAGSDGATEVTLTGSPWRGFDRTRITTVTPASAPVSTFETIDIRDGSTVTVPVGSQPAPTTTQPPATTTPATTTAAPTTTTTPSTTAPSTTTAAPPPRPASLELTGTSLGPLRIGMTIGDAQATGWLGRGLTTCSDLLELGPVPGNQLFQLDGPRAPRGLDATIETSDDRISAIAVSSPVRLPGGVDYQPAWNETAARSSLEGAGYQVTLGTGGDVFDAAEAQYRDGSTFGILFEGGGSIGIPSLAICD